MRHDADAVLTAVIKHNSKKIKSYEKDIITVGPDDNVNRRRRRTEEGRT